VFDFSIGKIAVLFLICLVVLGPQKLPRLAQQLGRLAGQARAMARHFRTQLEQEIAAEELVKQKRELEAALEKSASAVADPVQTMAKTADTAAQDILPIIDPGAANGSGHADYGPDPTPETVATNPSTSTDTIKPSA
jgi:sec-independent protein translocase protein TatB